jgi:23S rRNA (uridine2552-2'-O)-methyltransferase
MGGGRRSDHWARKARDEGYAARSVYKLQAIDDKAKLFRPGMRIVDLGCSPGSWSSYALQRVGRGGALVGIDLTPPPALPGATMLTGSVYEVEPSALMEALGGQADVVMSDMAPSTTGDRVADHLQQIELARCALGIAAQVSRPGGSFVCKVFEGGEAQDFVQEARALFTTVKRVRPDAVRRQSREWFLLASGRRG